MDTSPKPPAAPSPNLFDELTPEQLQRLLQGQTLADQGHFTEEELAQLLAEPQPDFTHETPGGALAGAIANTGNGLANSLHARVLRGDRRANIEQQGQLAGEFANLLRSPQAAPGAAPGTGAMPGMEPKVINMLDFIPELRPPPRKVMPQEAIDRRNQGVRGLVPFSFGG